MYSGVQPSKEIFINVNLSNITLKVKLRIFEQNSNMPGSCMEIVEHMIQN